MLLTAVRTSADRIGSSSPANLHMWFSPGRSLIVALCRLGTGAAGPDYTRSSAFSTEEKVILTGDKRSRMVRNAPGGDTSGAFGVLA